MPVNEDHRPYLEDMRMLSRDSDDREILCGLTFDETEWYFDYLNRNFGVDRHGSFGSAEEYRAARERYLALHDKHERVRLAIIFAESEARHSAKN